MKKQINLVELFSGIGSPRKALDNLGVNYKSLGYSEIDDHAIKSYCAIHNDVESNNLGDVREIEELPKDTDLLVMGAACQSVSVNGKKNGAVRGSGTRSSILWDAVDLIGKTKPRVVVWENVTGYLSKNNMAVFEEYLETMAEFGYKNSWCILNATDFGVPQNRERIFVISSLDKEFNFKTLKRKKLRKLEEFADFNYLPKTTTRNYNERSFCYQLENNKGELGTQAWRITTKEHNCIGTLGLTRCINIGEKVGENTFNYRQITANEAFRFMGFTDEDYNKASKVSNNTQISRQAGNSIVVDVIQELLDNVIKELL